MACRQWCIISSIQVVVSHIELLRSCEVDWLILVLLLRLLWGLPRLMSWIVVMVVVVWRRHVACCRGTRGDIVGLTMEWCAIVTWRGGESFVSRLMLRGLRDYITRPTNLLSMIQKVWESRLLSWILFRCLWSNSWISSMLSRLSGMSSLFAITLLSRWGCHICGIVLSSLIRCWDILLALSHRCCPLGNWSRVLSKAPSILFRLGTILALLWRTCILEKKTVSLRRVALWCLGSRVIIHICCWLLLLGINQLNRLSCA